MTIVGGRARVGTLVATTLGGGSWRKGVVEVIHFESGTLQVKFEDGPSECKPAGTLHRQTVQPVSPTVAKNQAMNVANGVVRLGTAVQNGNGTTGTVVQLDPLRKRLGVKWDDFAESTTFASPHSLWRQFPEPNVDPKVPWIQVSNGPARIGTEVKLADDTKGAIRQLGQGVAQVEFEDGRKDWVPGNALARIKPFVPAESQPQGDQAQQQQPGSQPQQPPSSQLQTKMPQGATACQKCSGKGTKARFISFAGKQKCKSCQGTGWIGPTVAPTPYIAADNQDTKATNESFGEVDPELGAGGEDTVDGDRAVSSNRSTSCSDGNSARIADNGHPLVGTSARAGGEVDVGVAGADVGGGGGGD
eukprot:CAMPEP_0174304352 /NCGR_PEP_ID=MMETSP0809-20121228/60735_1 /TAXON_ID=73025 ORGANISM="Eutreptiella gymnastica-like, Strain CCMP1594" /NCGR_SAMPLE_ID=MMETSP0809 /ASSEMBLY_ACC=CAM_ASM_000658 /LENGTH=360 /DNA_ID=CAMNT_0015410565 /DNA_START=80 /DNA_END=1165 /DNA_ORIENTATION=-